MANDPGHIFSDFDFNLSALRDGVLKMASMAQQNLENAVTGLLERNRELCGDAIADDDEVDNLERTIDRDGFDILLRFSPVASDLREVLANMKAANNLERISDESEIIARSARKILKQPEIPEIRKIEPLYHAVSEMVRDSVRAHAEGDVELSLSLKTRAKKVEKDHSALIKALAKKIDADTADIKTLLNLTYIARSLERISDFAKNLAEDAVFAEAATDVRHMSPKAAAAEVEVSKD